MPPACPWAWRRLLPTVSEQDLLVPALEDIPLEVPEGTPVIADKGHDSDPLRDDVQDAGFEPIIRIAATAYSRRGMTVAACAVTDVAGW